MFPYREKIDYLVSPEGCWIWRHDICPKGYAMEDGEKVARIILGIIGSTRVVRTCHNKACIRPDHLVLQKPPTDEDKVDYVLASNGCWLWQGERNKSGAAISNKTRVIDHVKQKPEGYTAYLICDCPHCVNPAHVRYFRNKPNQKVNRRQK